MYIIFHINIQKENFRKGFKRILTVNTAGDLRSAPSPINKWSTKTTATHIFLCNISLLTLLDHNIYAFFYHKNNKYLSTWINFTNTYEALICMYIQIKSTNKQKETAVFTQMKFDFFQKKPGKNLNKNFSKTKLLFITMSLKSNDSKRKYNLPKGG